MWAAGSRESIAVSTDGGQHWQCKHQDPKGALLLAMNFVGDRFGYAAGTGGTVLFTEDGGESWVAKKLADETILQAAFGDAQHGVIRTLSTLLATTDGGKSWKPIVPANDPGWVKKFPNTPEMAALDTNHFAVRVSEGSAGDGEFLVTEDGGATWRASYIPSSGIPGLFADRESYWSVGHEVVEKDKPGGGYATPMSFHSRDGISWEHTPINHEVCHWHDCGGCTPQGCFAGKSSFLQFLGGKDWFARFPVHEGLSSQWAKSGNTLCLLSESSVECTQLRQAQTLDTEEDSPSWEDRSFPAIGRAIQSNPQCIRCRFHDLIEDPVEFYTSTSNIGRAVVLITFRLDLSGQVNDVKITGDIPDDVREQIRGSMRNWLFEPFLKNGIPSATVISMRRGLFIINPVKPSR